MCLFKFWMACNKPMCLFNFWMAKCNKHRCLFNFWMAECNKRTCLFHFRMAKWNKRRCLSNSLMAECNKRLGLFHFWMAECNNRVCFLQFLRQRPMAPDCRGRVTRRPGISTFLLKKREKHQGFRCFLGAARKAPPQRERISLKTSVRGSDRALGMTVKADQGREKNDTPSCAGRHGGGHILCYSVWRPRGSYKVSYKIQTGFFLNPWEQKIGFENAHP